MLVSKESLLEFCWDIW